MYGQEKNNRKKNRNLSTRPTIKKVFIDSTYLHGEFRRLDNVVTNVRRRSHGSSSIYTHTHTWVDDVSDVVNYTFPTTSSVKLKTGPPPDSFFFKANFNIDQKFMSESCWEFWHNCNNEMENPSIFDLKDQVRFCGIDTYEVSTGDLSVWSTWVIEFPMDRIW